MYREKVIEALTDAGADGVPQSELFTGYRSSNAAVALTNELAKMRRTGEIVLRRDGPNRTYYLPEHAPSLPSAPVPPAE